MDRCLDGPHGSEVELHVQCEMNTTIPSKYSWIAKDSHSTRTFLLCGRKVLLGGGPPTWLDKCLRSYSPSNIQKLWVAIKEAHRLKGSSTDGEVIIRGRGMRSFYTAMDAGFEALGVNDYMRARDIIAKWPRIERYLLKQGHI